MNAVDNHAHAGGFVGGYAAALLLDPSKRERIDHLLGALACLVITVGGDCRIDHHQLRGSL